MIKRTLSAAGIVVACCVAMLIVNILHFRFFTVNVVLYDALMDTVIAVVLVLAVYLAIVRRRSMLSGLEVALCVLIGFLLSSFYALSVPTIIDRSLSFYILEKIAQRGGGIQQSGFAQIFKDEYLPEHRLVDIRLTEQLNSGTVKIEDGCVSLTPRGEHMVAFSRFYRLNMLPKKREIMGKLSDDLVDPFRNSKQAADYKCKPKPN